MYIAFKWLAGLAVAMWVAMCCVDMYLKSKEELKGPTHSILFKNLTLQVESKSENRVSSYDKMNMHRPASIEVIHCYMFFAGALAVSIFNKKTEIILYAKQRIRKIDIIETVKLIKNYMAKSFTMLGIEMLHLSNILRNYLKNISYKKIQELASFLKIKRDDSQYKVNRILLDKLREIGEEKKNLGQLLMAAIHENKNIRMQYQLESMAKTRLLRHIDDTHKQIKENRSRYVSFQHLYLVTHQENIFLKARIRKLQLGKDEAEKNLLCLINEVYKSKNTELKSYCSRFIVHTKDNLLNSDVNAEIRKFLGSQRSATSINFGHRNKANSGPDDAGISVTEICNEDDSLVPLVSDAPRLKGLPGEYVWTVKDKDGIIEKLYEYDYETDADNGDTIRRIRQYSVYCDDECLLDYTKSTTILPEANAEPRLQRSFSNANYAMGNGRFLTGSRAFQSFLRDNKNIIVNSPSLQLPTASA